MPAITFINFRTKDRKPDPNAVKKAQDIARNYGFQLIKWHQDEPGKLAVVWLNDPRSPAIASKPFLQSLAEANVALGYEEGQIG
jgi:hypothetical protein